MSVTTVKFDTIVPSAEGVALQWESDQPATGSSVAYVSEKLENLQVVGKRFAMLAQGNLPRAKFRAVAITPAMLLKPETIYYCRATCDGVESETRTFATLPKRLPPSPILLRMFAKPVQVTRAGLGAYDQGSGKFIAGTETVFPVLMSIQPVSLREMFIFPEGERTKQMVKTYSDVRLLEAINQTGQKGDRFDYNGRLYEVKNTGTWNAPGRTRINFFKSVAVTVEQDDQL